MSISGIAGEIGGVNYYNNVNRKTNSQAETFSMENYDKTNVNDENDFKQQETAFALLNSISQIL